MLRVGLTGNLGSGKSTAARLFAARGAHVLASDAIGRDLMQPGQRVFQAIVEHFGPTILTREGTLDRAALARIAFAAHGDAELETLNAIVHPAVIARQAELAAELFRREPHAILIVESALVFETRHGEPATGEAAWHTRFDRILLVTAPQSEKIARFVRRQHPAGEPGAEQRAALEAEAHRRLAHQMPDPVKAQRCDDILVNDGSLSHLEAQIDILWPILQEAERSLSSSRRSP